MSLELGSLYGVWQMRESCGISGHQPRINQLARDGLDAAIEKVLNLIQETKWPVSTPHSIFVGGICLQQPVPRTESLILLGLISYFQPLPATSSRRGLVQTWTPGAGGHHSRLGTEFYHTC